MNITEEIEMLRIKVEILARELGMSYEDLIEKLKHPFGKPKE